MLGLIPAIRAERGSRRSADATAGRLITHADPAIASRGSVSVDAHEPGICAGAAVAAGDRGGEPGSVGWEVDDGANLAITFAQQGQRTLLIDADLRRAVLDKAFSVTALAGAHGGHHR